MAEDIVWQSRKAFPEDFRICQPACRAKEVRPMIERPLTDLSDVQVVGGEPAGAHDDRAMPVGTERPKVTVPRALFAQLMERYAITAYRLTWRSKSYRAESKKRTASLPSQEFEDE